MKNYLLPIVVALLVVVIAVQGYYLYRIDQRLEPQQKAQMAPSVGGSITDPFATMPLFNSAGDPFNAVQQMHEQMNRLFADTMQQMPFEEMFSNMLAQSNGTPALDMRETNDGYTIVVDIPGATANSINVSVADNQLQIQAKTEQESSQNSNGVLRKERYFGQFSRSVTLPEPVNPATLHTDYENGVLTITVDKVK